MAFPRNKPRIPRINWGNRLSRGIVLDINPFEGSGTIVRDRGPYKQDGTLTGGPTWTSDREITFSTTAKYIDCGTLLSTLISDRVTVVFRRRKTDATARVSAAFGADNTGDDTRILSAYLPFNDGTVYWDFGGNGAGVNRLSVAGLSFGNDTFIFTAGPRYGMAIWQNGKRVASNAATPTRDTTAVAFTINKMAAVAGDLMDFDLCRVYNRELTPQEIKKTFNDPYEIYKKTPVHYFSSTSADNYSGGYSLAFAAGTQKVTVADNPSINLTGNFTLAAWIYPTTIGESLVFEKDGYTATGYALLTNASYFALTNVFGVLINNNYLFTNSGTVTANQWQHIAATYDGTNVRFYLNGTLVKTTAWSTNPSTNSSAAIIGNNAGTTRDFVGNIDEVMVFKNRVLSATDISNLANRTFITRSSLSAHYRFNEGTGTSTADSSPNGNTGTISGATWSSSQKSLFPTSLDATGGVVTTDGLYTIHTFTTSGTFTPAIPGVADVLVVGGGGGGGGPAGRGGGGGAGELEYQTNFAVTQQAYTVTVGAGGAGSTAGSVKGVNGSDSVFDTITALGGGGGGTGPGANKAGANGGNGGGGGDHTGAGAGGVGSPGFNGGDGLEAAPSYGAGGGGGMGAVGQTGSSSKGGDGGVGVSNSITGSAVFYAGGGGGAASDAGATYGAGGNGGGGRGSSGNAAPVAGTANTGGGGGGGNDSGGYNGAAGGSGIVIIRYYTEAAQASSGVNNGYHISRTRGTAYSNHSAVTYASNRTPQHRSNTRNQ